MCSTLDNELPDYIMVMLVNKKTFQQINNDLQLFLGTHTNPFTEWLQKVVADPDLLKKRESLYIHTCTCILYYMYMYRVGPRSGLGICIQREWQVHVLVKKAQCQQQGQFSACMYTVSIVELDLHVYIYTVHLHVHVVQSMEVEYRRVI